MRSWCYNLLLLKADWYAYNFLVVSIETNIPTSKFLFSSLFRNFPYFFFPEIGNVVFLLFNSYFTSCPLILGLAQCLPWAFFLLLCRRRKPSLSSSYLTQSSKRNREFNGLPCWTYQLRCKHLLMQALSLQDYLHGQKQMTANVVNTFGPFLCHLAKQFWSQINCRYGKPKGISFFFFLFSYYLALINDLYNFFFKISATVYSFSRRHDFLNGCAKNL